MEGGKTVGKRRDKEKTELVEEGRRKIGEGKVMNERKKTINKGEGEKRNREKRKRRGEKLMNSI